MLPLRVDRDGDVFMQVQGVDCFARPWAARPVDWTVRWVVYRLQTRGCGTVKHRYSETGNIGGKRTATAQYTEASHITATELGCGRAKAIVRRYLTTWRSYNHGPGRVKGYRCSYDRAGSDIGSGLCTRAERAAIEFDLYDSSPFH